jgi:CRISPR-associated endoribonuclease Cas6
MSRGLEQLEARLREPMHRVDLPGLLDLWQHDDVVVLCQRPSDLEGCPDLPLRIRGALGNALEALCEDDVGPDPFDRPSAHRLMFKWKPPRSGLIEVATPYVVRAEVRGDIVEVRLRLFGAAGYHAPVVVGALIAALESGVSIRNHGARACFAVTDARIERFDGAARDWVPQGSAVTLHLLTPVIIRRNQNIQIEPLSLLRSTMRRAQAIAPWMDCTLIVDEDRLIENGRRLHFNMMGVHSETWERTSRNNPGKGIPMQGYGGKVLAEGDLGDWATYLDLAQYASLGGECALGFGAVRAIIYP